LGDNDRLDPSQREYDLLPPDQILIPFSVLVPTSTALTPIRLRLPVLETTTMADCLVALRRELGLPVSTLDLVGPGSRSKGSQVGSGDTAIRWAVRLGQDGERLELDRKVTEVFKVEVVIHVSIDEEWLYELTPSHSKSPSMATQVDTGEKQEKGEDDGSKEDTLKAASPRSRTAILAKAQDTSSPQSPVQARLSGLFHAWVDTNQHPAPPSTPQLTLVGGEAATALAGLLSEGMEDRLVISPSQAQVDDGTPTRASGGEMVSEIPSLVGIVLNIQGPVDQGTPTKSSRRYSLIPNLAFPANSSPRTPIARPFISLSTASGSTLTKLLAQSTGDSTTSTASQDTWGARFGLGLWAGGTPIKSPQVDQGSIKSVDGASLSGSVKPLEKQVTGGLWSWWTGSKPEEGSAEAYVEGLRAE
jgi:diaphanous 1